MIVAVQGCDADAVVLGGDGGNLKHGWTRIYTDSDGGTGQGPSEWARPNSGSAG